MNTKQSWDLYIFVGIQSVAERQGIPDWIDLGN